MPKGKKGSGKLAKMTEEERLLYLEQQRLAEEELRKKKEDMLVVYLKVSIAFHPWPNLHIGRPKVSEPL